jgi:methyl-accepting chemotaxis protein
MSTAASELTSGAEEISRGNMNLSQRTEEQASSLEETASSMEGMTALNAAVEAARAGEQGRGFAVVASAVRNLAGRSATAAKEIKSLILDSVTKVEQGSRLVDDCRRSLAEIVTSVKKVTDIVAEIAAASLEQSSGIEQVNKAVMQMDQTTQQNAALVEEAAAASQAIVGQAKTLNAMIARHRVDTGTTMAGAKPKVAS